jgi:ABC-2 type transport system permease protein
MSNKVQSKMWTIISHEYLTKVKSKGFILSTILGPIGLIVFIGVMALVAIISSGSGSRSIAVLDQSGMGIGQELAQHDKQLYYLTNEPVENLRKKVLSGQSDGFLEIPSDVLESSKASIYTSGGGGLGFIASIERDLDRVVRHKRLAKAGVDPKVAEMLEKSVDVQTQKVTEKGEEKDYAEVFAGVGYVFGFIVYIMVILYGQFVRSGVTEEKANRIVEVIASSARPFDIMMGKVIGIGAVGLTQILVWIVFAVLAMLAAGPIVGSFMHPEAMTAAMQASGQASPIPANFELPHISPWLYVGFVFYFLSGYFIYATLFAAVGSVVDQESDAQQLQWPVMIPIILPMLFIGVVISDPDNMTSVILSLIPFFSPILMMVRVAATSVPIWQIALSVVLIVLTFLGSIWATARIYRVGILMYGKRPTIKDMIKWTRLAK